MMFGFEGCCCKPKSCTVVYDPFLSWSDPGTPPNDSVWEIERGDWVVTGPSNPHPYVLAGSGSGAVLRCKKTTYTGYESYVVWVVITLEPNSTGRVIVGYTDNDDYYFVQLQSDADNEKQLMIYHHTSGGNMLLSEVQAGTASSYTVKVCVTPEYLYAGYAGNSSVYYVNECLRVSLVTPIPKVVGLGTNDSAIFAGFTLAYHGSEMSGSGCLTCEPGCLEGCIDSYAPTKLQLAVQGYVTTPGKCRYCPDRNGTWTLDRTGNCIWLCPEVMPLGNCTYSTNIPYPGASHSEPRWQANLGRWNPVTNMFTTGEEYPLALVITESYGWDMIWDPPCSGRNCPMSGFRILSDEPFDCTHFDETPLEVWGYCQEAGYEVCCDMSGVSATITSIVTP